MAEVCLGKNRLPRFVPPFEDNHARSQPRRSPSSLKWRFSCRASQSLSASKGYPNLEDVQDEALF